MPKPIWRKSPPECAKSQSNTMVALVLRRVRWQCAPAMAFHWKIDSQEKLITVVADGDVTRAEVEAFLDVLEGIDGFSYRKLFDGTTADTKMPPDEILALGVRMRAAHTEDRTLGALAAVVPDDKIELVSRVLGMLAAAKRPMRVFSTLAPAQEWLQRQPRV